MCKQCGFPCGERSYEHSITSEMRVLENDGAKVLWDVLMQTDQKLEHNRPDIAIVKKEIRTCNLIVVACPFDTRIKRKEKEKLELYTELKHEILKCWSNEVETVIIIPVVFGALGMVTKILESYLKKDRLYTRYQTIPKNMPSANRPQIEKGSGLPAVGKGQRGYTNKQTIATLDYWLWLGSKCK